VSGFICVHEEERYRERITAVFEMRVVLLYHSLVLSRPLLARSLSLPYCLMSYV
jgi:hypothetical protein